MIKLDKLFKRDKLCKACTKKRSARDWHTYPRISAHLVWRDENKVWHYYPDYEYVTYCGKPAQ